MTDDHPTQSQTTDRSPKDYAIEFGRYLADAAEQFLVELNRAAVAEEMPCTDHWSALESAIHEFRKRALRAERGISTL